MCIYRQLGILYLTIMYWNKKCLICNRSLKKSRFSTFFFSNIFYLFFSFLFSFSYPIFFIPYQNVICYLIGRVPKLFVSSYVTFIIALSAQFCMRNQSGRQSEWVGREVVDLLVFFFFHWSKSWLSLIASYNGYTLIRNQLATA